MVIFAITCTGLFLLFLFYFLLRYVTLLLCMELYCVREWELQPTGVEWEREYGNEWHEWHDLIPRGFFTTTLTSRQADIAIL